MESADENHNDDLPDLIVDDHYSEREFNESVPEVLYWYNTIPGGGIVYATYTSVHRINVCVQLNSVSNEQIQEINCILYEHYLSTGANPTLSFQMFPYSHTNECIDQYFTYIGKLQLNTKNKKSVAFDDMSEGFGAELLPGKWSQAV